MAEDDGFGGSGGSTAISSQFHIGLTYDSHYDNKENLGTRLLK